MVSLVDDLLGMLWCLGLNCEVLEAMQYLEGVVKYWEGAVKFMEGLWSIGRGCRVLGRDLEHRGGCGVFFEGL